MAQLRDSAAYSMASYKEKINLTPSYRLECLQSAFSLKPLNPNIHMQILQTDFNTFFSSISWENVIKDQSILPLDCVIDTDSKPWEEQAGWN